MKVKEILSRKEFEKAIAHGTTLVDFYAPWCAPCRVQEPIVKQLAKEFEGKASVLKLNVEKSREIAMSQRIYSIPTLIIFMNGKEILRYVGLQSEETLSNAIQKTLN
nr:thioredoxin [Desulfobacterales bacterium]